MTPALQLEESVRQLPRSLADSLSWFVLLGLAVGAVLLLGELPRRRRW